MVRRLRALEAIAFEALDDNLPRTRDVQALEDALNIVQDEVFKGFPPGRAEGIARTIAKGVNRKHRSAFFGAVARTTKLNIIGTDEPGTESVEEEVGGLFSVKITKGPGGVAVVKANLNPDLFVEQFARETTKHITTLSAGIIPGTRDAIVREVMLGQGDPEVLTDRLVRSWKKKGVPSCIPTKRRTKDGRVVCVNIRDHASLIARDQIGTLQMQLTQTRQEAAGITHAVWRMCCGGQDVRPAHVARNGQTYLVASGLDGEYPGGPIACRCTPRP